MKPLLETFLDHFQLHRANGDFALNPGANNRREQPGHPPAGSARPGDHCGPAGREQCQRPHSQRGRLYEHASGRSALQGPKGSYLQASRSVHHRPQHPLRAHSRSHGHCGDH